MHKRVTTAASSDPLPEDYTESGQITFRPPEFWLLSSPAKKNLFGMGTLGSTAAAYFAITKQQAIDD